MGAVKVRDFAKECGCTTQNIYQHLKTYEIDLMGHTWKGPGRTGVYLDDEAQAFLRSIMYPKELADSTLANEIMELRTELLQMGTKMTEMSAKLVAAEGERDRALMEAGHYQKALMASEEAEKAKTAELEAAKKDALEASERAQRAEAELAAYKALPWYKKLRRG